MRFFAFSAVLVALLICLLVWADNKEIAAAKACIAVDGVPVRSLADFVCIRKDAVLKGEL